MYQHNRQELEFSIDIKNAVKIHTEEYQLALSQYLEDNPEPNITIPETLDGDYVSSDADQLED